MSGNAATSDLLEPHIYFPDFEAMGDCVTCGRVAEDSIHVSPSSAATRRESLVTDLASVDATHEWITEHVGDHAYAHGLAHDVFALLRLLAEVDEWLNSPQESGGGHIAVHAALCPGLARRIREVLMDV